MTSKEKRSVDCQKEQAWRVLAIAGDWSTSDELARLGDAMESSAMRGGSANPKKWRDRLDAWFREDRIEAARDAGARVHYRLSRSDSHEALVGLSKEMLNECRTVLARAYFLPYRPIRDARLALYARDVHGFENAVAYSDATSILLDLVGEPPIPYVYELLSHECREHYLTLVASRGLQLEGPAPALLLESEFASLAGERVALKVLGGDMAGALLELAKVDPEKDKSGRLYAAMTVMELARNDVAAARVCAFKALQTSKGKKKFPSLDGPLSAWVAFCAITGTPQERAMAELMMSNPKREGSYRAAAEDMVIFRFLSWLSSGTGVAIAISKTSYLRKEWNNLAKLWYRVLVAWGVAEEDTTVEDEGEDELIALKQAWQEGAEHGACECLCAQRMAGRFA